MKQMPLNKGSGRVAALRDLARKPAMQELDKTLEEYQRLSTKEAKLGFADQWLGSAASNFEFSWPMIYELGRLVRDERTYESEHASFEAYWKSKFEKAFGTFTELEATYHFIELVAPQLRGATWTDAKAAKVVAEGAAAEAKEPIGPRGNPTGRNKHSDPEESLSDKQSNNGEVPGKGGTRAQYLAHRVATAAKRGDQKAAEVLEAMKAGQYRSVRSAALDAGILRPPDPVRLVLRAVVKMTREQRLEVFRKLLEAYPDELGGSE